jgi:hypothetical protein
MKTPKTTPAVITDRNGKVTTVHRKDVEVSRSRASIPSVLAMTQEPKPEQQGLKALASSLYDRASEWAGTKESHALATCTSKSERAFDVATLRLLNEFVTDGTRNANALMEAAVLLNEMGEDPHSYITSRHADAVFHIQDALVRWEMKHDNYKGGDIERRSEGREAFILYVLEDPTRDVIVAEALKRGMVDLNAVMEFEKDAGTVHRGVSDGRL